MIVLLRRFLGLGAYILDGGHNAHRPAEVIESGSAGNKLAQTEPHHLHKIHSLIPGVTDAVGYGGRDRQPPHIQAKALIRLPLLVGAGLPGDIFRQNMLPITDNLNIRRFIGIAQKHLGVAAEIGAPAVDLIDLIPGL